MKVLPKFLLMILIVGVFNQVEFSQNSDISEQIMVDGKLISAEIEESRLTKINLKLEITFSNCLTKPIILPKNVSDLKVWEIFIANSKVNLHNSKFIYVNSLKESLLGEDKEFTKSMIKTKPPSERVVIVKPNQQISYSMDIHFWLEKNRMYSATEVENSMKRIPTFWLKLGINVYFDSDVYRLLPNEKITFGAKIKKNWAKFGVFQFGRVYSEPIPLDFSLAVVKTESKP